MPDSLSHSPTESSPEASARAWLDAQKALKSVEIARRVREQNDLGDVSESAWRSRHGLPDSPPPSSPSSPSRSPSSPSAESDQAAFAAGVEAERRRQQQARATAGPRRLTMRELIERGKREKEERIGRRRKVVDEAEQKWIERYLADCKARGWDEDAVCPPCISRSIWATASTIIGDPTGAAGRAFLREASRAYSGLLIDKIREAAFEPQPDGTYRYDWSDERTRKIVALAIVLLKMSKASNMCAAFGGRGRAGRVGRLVRGIPLSALASLLSLPWQRDKFPTAANLTARVGNWRGYLAALEDSGFCRFAQLPASQVESWERGCYTGRAFNRYYIADPMLQGRAMTDEEVERNKRGWDFCDEVIIRAFRAAERKWIALIAATLRLVDPAPA